MLPAQFFNKVDMSHLPEEELCSPESFLAAARKITYKPGFDIAWSLCDDNRILRMKCLISVCDPVTLKPTKVEGTKQFPIVSSSLSLFLYDVQSTLIDWEVHEMKEWFKYDGQIVEEPHPDNTSLLGHYTYMPRN